MTDKRLSPNVSTVKLGDKERFGKEQIVVKDQLPTYFMRIRNIWR